MKTIYDPTNRWVSAAPLVLSSSNKTPIAVDDALNLVVDSGPVTVNVLGNDFDPEGASLTLVSASAALGTAVAESDNTITYTPFPGIAGFDTIVYEIADDLDQRDTGQVNVTISEQSLSVDVQANNTLLVTVETGALDLTVTTPVNFAGTYAINTSDLQGGPINLVSPELSGSPSAGAQLTATSGLWVHDPSAAPLIQSWQWLQAGTEIAGATGPNYTMTAADVGQGISVREISSDGLGQRIATSAAVSQFFTPASDGALNGWWDAADASTLTATGGLVSAWADKSGGAALSQPVSTQQPSTGVRSLNGLNVIDFNGARFLQRGTSLPTSGDVAFHMVFSVDAIINAYQAVLAVDGTNDFQIDANNASQFDGRLNTTGIGSSANLTGGPFTGAVILSIIFDRTGTGTAEVFVANVSRATMTYSAPLDQFVDLLLMTNRSKNAWVDGAVAELVVTGDITNRAAYHTYLATKWGLS